MFHLGEGKMPPGLIRLARDEAGDEDVSATQQSIHPVAITQSLEDRVKSIEEQFLELDGELRRRFGDHSYSVDRSEQVLGAIQRLHWAISRSPVVNPLPQASDSDDEFDSR
jgi:hypothetical protein